MMIFAGVCALISFVTLPETYAPILLARKARRLRADSPTNVALYAAHERQDWSIRGVLQRSLFRPFIMLAKEPILVLITIYMSIIYGVLYALFQAFPIIYVKTRGMSLSQDGLIFIGVGIGTTLGSIINYLLSRKYPALIKRWRGFPPPEERLTGAKIAGPTLVVGIFWMGWTGQYESVPWYVPAIASILVGTAISLVFMSFLVCSRHFFSTLHR
jgi:DHA1 family multidrug resistance protein-like MFS transporter